MSIILHDDGYSVFDNNSLPILLINVKPSPIDNRIKKKIDEWKNKIGVLTEEQKKLFDKITHSEYEAGLKKKAKELGIPCVTNAWLKMWELKQFLPNEDIIAFHIAEAPGAFILALHHHFSRSRLSYQWMAETYRGSGALGDTYHLIKNYPNNWTFGIKGNGDITDPENIRSFGKGVFNLVTGDARNDTKNFNEEETENIAIQMGQILTAFWCLRKGGVAILKTFTQLSPLSLSLNYLFSTQFRRTHFVKPITSRSANSEIYLVGEGYKGTLSDEYFNHLFNILNDQRKQVNSTIQLFDVPNNFKTKMFEINKKLAEKQINAINITIKNIGKNFPDRSSEWLKTFPLYPPYGEQLSCRKIGSVQTTQMDDIKLPFIKRTDVTEIELRFGKWINEIFKPISYPTFEFLKRKFTGSSEKSVDIYQGQIRQTGSTFVLKRNYQKTDYKNYNCRLSVAEEIIPVKNDPLIPEAYRKKERWSLIEGKVRLDLTIVNEFLTYSGKHTINPERQNVLFHILNKLKIKHAGNATPLSESNQQVVDDFVSKPPVKYEFEIEYIGKESQSDFEQTMKHYIQTYGKIVGDLENTVNSYYNLVGNNKFIGSLPVALKSVSDIKNNYFVTDKADGERMLLFVNNGILYSITRNMVITKISEVPSKYNNTIMDSEQIGSNYYTFDILFNRGNDSRNKITSERLQQLEQIVKELGLFNIKYKISLPATPENIENIYTGIHEYKIDGLIFTPNEKYSSQKNWKSQFKWKEIPTIDFRIVYNSNEITSKIDVDLYVVGKNGEEIYHSQTMPISDLYNKQDSTWNYANNSIVECRWSWKSKTYKIVKSRSDKSIPNYIDIAKDTKESIDLNITFSKLIGKEIPKFPKYEAESQKLSLTEYTKDINNDIRTFNNNVKRDLLKKYTKDTLLDLATGKGGDIQKWCNHTKLTKVIGIDSSEKSIKVANERKKEFCKDKDIRFIVGDILDINNLINSEQFDTVSCFFALHYFFKNESMVNNFIDILSQRVIDNGYFIGTTFDGDTIFNKLKEVDQIDNEFYTIKKEYTTKSEFGMPINVTVKGGSNVKGFTEYLVFFDVFIKKMEEKGFKMVSSSFLDPSSIKNNLQKEFISYNRSFVFQKGSSEGSRTVLRKIESPPAPKQPSPPATIAPAPKQPSPPATIAPAPKQPSPPAKKTPPKKCNVTADQIPRSLTIAKLKELAQKLNVYIPSKVTLKADITQLVLDKLNTMSLTDPVCQEVMAQLKK